MIILQQVGYYETVNVENEHLNGKVICTFEPPKDLACPNQEDTRFNFLIQSDSITPEHWNGCLAHWDDQDWLISGVQEFPTLTHVDDAFEIWIDRLPLFDVLINIQQRKLKIRVSADNAEHATTLAQKPGYKIRKVTEVHL